MRGAYKIFGIKNYSLTPGRTRKEPDSIYFQAYDVYCQCFTVDTISLRLNRTEFRKLFLNMANFHQTAVRTFCTKNPEMLYKLSYKLKAMLLKTKDIYVNL